MFKIFGKEKKGKKEKENSKPELDKNLPPDLTPEERKEAEKLPFGGNTRLSKSKSGRYKVKNKQRGALDGDIYATGGSVPGGATSSTSSTRTAAAAGTTAASGRPAGAQGSSYVSSNAQGSSSTGSTSFGQQQGSLGRSSGGHCGVANSVTKRYSGATASISSQPTAV